MVAKKRLRPHRAFDYTSNLCRTRCRSSSWSSIYNSSNCFVMIDFSSSSLSLSFLFSPDSEEHTTISIQSINRQVIYKFCPARRFYEFIPLSVGIVIVDKSLHGITVTNSIIERIARCLGKNGLFSRRPRSPHRGALSFLGLGLRSLHTVAQPNPSEVEGDMTSFWYYRKHLNQVWVWWGLVLKVIKVLTS